MSPTQRNSDQDWMTQALALARDVRGHVWPNPPVGCVIVKDGERIAEAATYPGGRPHAERQALDHAGGSAKGATLYVTLEPCCHWGKTPPCADAIIKAGIARVVCAIQDPDPRVNGGGFARLRDAGLRVDIGTCADEAGSVMSGFFHRIRTGAPELVTCDENARQIPTGIDALLATRDGAAVLTTRSGDQNLIPQTAGDISTCMVRLGLTLVAIPRHDPLWQKIPAPTAKACRQPQAVIADQPMAR